MPKREEDKVLAIVPARAGSKGLKNKNIKPLLGKPLIGWVLEEAAKSKEIDDIVVTTDSHKIAKIAARYGAKIPFLRPKGLALDSTPGIRPILHALHFYKTGFGLPDIVVCLQCTSPLTRACDMDKAIKMFRRSKFDSLISVCPVKESPHWMVSINSRKQLKPVLDKKLRSSRQELPPTYRFNGAIYISRPQTLLKKQSWLTENTGAFVMKKEISFDIDTKEDFLAVKDYLKKNRKRKSLTK